jgi:hypothetical protein
MGPALNPLGMMIKKYEKGKVVLEINGTKQFESMDVARGFNNFFTSVASQLVSLLPLPVGTFSTNSVTFLDYYRQRGIYGTQMTLSPVTSHFIWSQLVSLDSHKSAGLDGLAPVFLKDAAEVIGGPIGHIVNLSILTETVPDDLKHARVTPIFKKGSRLDAGNYRPVSVLNILSKILERAVCTQLNGYLNDKGLLYDFQSGFRNKYSTDTCLLGLTDYVRTEISKGNLVGMILIDLQKAFDTVNHTILCEKLSAMGVGSVDWFRSYLTGRTQCVRVDESTSEHLEVSCGVPQGSILGPTLFLCFINDMPSSLNCMLSLYADDSALVAPGKNVRDIEKFLCQEFVDAFTASQLYHVLIS